MREAKSSVGRQMSKNIPITFEFHYHAQSVSAPDCSDYATIHFHPASPPSSSFCIRATEADLKTRLNM